MMVRTGLAIAGKISFPDHAALGSGDLVRLGNSARLAKAVGFLTTMKDLVKLRCSEIAGIPVWGVKIRLEFLVGGQELADRLP